MKQKNIRLNRIEISDNSLDCGSIAAKIDRKKRIHTYAQKKGAEKQEKVKNKNMTGM